MGRLAKVLLALACAAGCSSGALADEAVTGWAGKIDGSWHWRLPDTPNGLKPYVSWHAVGSAPNGDIYVAGMDHVTNAALYQLPAATRALRYVGDARSASEAAGNWQTGETAEKFHTRPTWHLGRIYLATMDYSPVDAGYLQRRGFHWYAYDPASDTFADLSAAERGGVGADHLGVVTIAADPARDLLYGAAVPTGHILQYNVQAQKTTDLGRPDIYDRDHLYAGRFMWVDSRGRLYFSAGNSRWKDYPEAIYGHLYDYDPDLGFAELKDWTLRETRAIETGQCIDGGQTCFLADDRSHVYRFDDDPLYWSYIGQAVIAADRSWVFHVSLDGKKAYVVPSPFNPGEPDGLYEIDLQTGQSRFLCHVSDLAPELTDFDWHTGYGSWDSGGRFYFVSFPSPRSPMYRGANAILTAIDPVQLKKALGLVE